VIKPETDARQFLTDCLGWGQLNIKIPKLVKKNVKDRENYTGVWAIPQMLGGLG
jgi:hypothetical protein